MPLPAYTQAHVSYFPLTSTLISVHFLMLSSKLHAKSILNSNDSIILLYRSIFIPDIILVFQQIIIHLIIDSTYNIPIY